MEFEDQLRLALRLRYPIWIESMYEENAISAVHYCTHSFIWSAVGPTHGPGHKMCPTIKDAIDWLDSQAPRGYTLVVPDIHLFIDDPYVQRLSKEISHRQRTLIGVSPHSRIPKELQPHFTLLRFKDPPSEIEGLTRNEADYVQARGKEVFGAKGIDAAYIEAQKKICLLKRRIMNAEDVATNDLWREIEKIEESISVGEQLV